MNKTSSCSPAPEPSLQDILALVVQGDQAGFCQACQQMTCADGPPKWGPEWGSSAMKLVLRSLLEQPHMELLAEMWVKRLPPTGRADIWADPPDALEEHHPLMHWLERRASPLDRARSAAAAGRMERVDRALAVADVKPEDIASVRTMAALHHQWDVVAQMWSRGTPPTAIVGLVWRIEDPAQREVILQRFTPRE